MLLTNLLCLQLHTVGLHTQYMLLTNLLCLQLHTVRSPYTVHAANQLAVSTAAHSRSPYTVHASNQLAVPTAAHSTVYIFHKFEISILLKPRHEIRQQSEILHTAHSWLETLQKHR